MSDARTLFFKRVDSVIFKEHEIRSLQSFVSDYKRIISDYRYVAGDVRSSYVKELLIEEYGETIGFKERSEMNKSAWVYDVAGRGDYIEAAISSLGISDEQLNYRILYHTCQNKSKTLLQYPGLLRLINLKMRRRYVSS